jgi:hypothetical protein
MWCIGVLTEEYRRRMYALLALYARPLSRAEPVVCIDEKSLQLLGHSREPLPMTEGAPAKHDYEYERKGTTNLFVAVEPKAGHRVVAVTEHRGKADFVAFIDELLTNAYAKARRVHLVLDNLNIHFRKCFDDVRRCEALAPSRVPLHAQARQLVEHGRDRDRHPQPPVSEPAHRQPAHPAQRGQRVAAGAKRPGANHRVEVHSTGC